MKPATAYFDGEREPTVALLASAPSGGSTSSSASSAPATASRCAAIASATSRPGKVHELRWDGRRGDRGVAADGAYEFRIGPPGHRGASAGRFEFHDHAFPVARRAHLRRPLRRAAQRRPRARGPGPARGLRHPLVAARGGTRRRHAATATRSTATTSLIDGLATDRDYFYAHLQAPTPLAEGDRVRTGERIGEVGKTGNARTEFCQLHFELWPDGYRDGGPRTRSGAARVGRLLLTTERWPAMTVAPG